MNKLNIVKKSISNKDISNNYELFEKHWIKVKERWLKLKLSNKKHFMKKRIDRKLNIEISKSLSSREEIFINRCWYYIDEYNEININKMSEDYSYSPSLISQLKKWVIEKWLIMKVWKCFYLSPLIWIKTKEIDIDLIRIFKDTFKKYNVEII